MAMMEPTYVTVVTETEGIMQAIRLELGLVCKKCDELGTIEEMADHACKISEDSGEED